MSSSGDGIIRYFAPLKTPTAVLKYQFDWSDWLNGAQIQTSVWAADTGVTVSGIAPVGPITAVSVSGGTERTAYRVTNTVTSDAGETDTRTVLIVVGPTTAGANGIQADMLAFRLYSMIAPRGESSWPAMRSTGFRRMCHYSSELRSTWWLVKPPTPCLMASRA